MLPPPLNPSSVTDWDPFFPHHWSSRDPLQKACRARLQIPPSLIHRMQEYSPFTPDSDSVFPSHNVNLYLRMSPFFSPGVLSPARVFSFLDPCWMCPFAFYELFFLSPPPPLGHRPFFQDHFPPPLHGTPGDPPLFFSRKNV